jgi:hypothetical protein
MKESRRDLTAPALLFDGMDAMDRACKTGQNLQRYHSFSYSSRFGNALLPNTALFRLGRETYLLRVRNIL